MSSEPRNRGKGLPDVCRSVGEGERGGSGALRISYGLDKMEWIPEQQSRLEGP